MTSSDGETNQGGTLFKGVHYFQSPFLKWGTNQGGKPRSTDTQKNLIFNFKFSFIFEYRMRAIISRVLYFFYPIVTSAAAYITDNLCTKNRNSSFFKPNIRGL